MTALFQRIALALVATTVCVVPDGARAQSVITAKASSAASGSAATAVISVDLPAGQQLATLQFNLTVTPVGTAPPLEQPAAFVNALAPPQIGPSLVLNEGNSIVLVGWLQEIAPALTGHVDLGTLTVPIPAGAQVDDRYRIEINRASGTADGRTAVALTAASDEFAVVPGLPALSLIHI